MDIQTLTSFFMWCTIINGAMLVIAGLLFLLVPDFIYRLHGRWVNISREAFNVVYYAIIAFFKVVFIFFNLVPWIVLMIIQ